MCVYLELAVATEVDVDEQQPASAVQEHDTVVVVEIEAAQPALVDKHEPALPWSDSHRDIDPDSYCMQDKP